MKHIMISIRPEWVEKILNGEKTLEIRKSFPKEECIVELYCTKGDRTLAFDEFSGILTGYPKYELLPKERKTYTPKLNGKIVARWHQKKCDKIEICDPDILLNGEQKSPDYFKKFACLTCEQLMEYIGCGQDNGWEKEWDTGYSWHIDNLEIYDTPKELADFGLKRAPQSWQCLEEV